MIAVDDDHPLKHAIGVEERENAEMYLQVTPSFLMLQHFHRARYNKCFTVTSPNVRACFACVGHTVCLRVGLRPLEALFGRRVDCVQSDCDRTRARARTHTHKRAELTFTPTHAQSDCDCQLFIHLTFSQVVKVQSLYIQCAEVREQEKP